MLTRDKHKSTWKWTKKAKILSTAPFKRFCCQIYLFFLPYSGEFCLHPLNLQQRLEGKIQARGKRGSEFTLMLISMIMKVMLPQSHCIWNREKENHWTSWIDFAEWKILFKEVWWKWLEITESTFQTWFEARELIIFRKVTFILSYEFLSLFVWNENTEKRHSSSIKVCSWTFCLMVQF